MRQSRRRMCVVGLLALSCLRFAVVPRFALDESLQIDSSTAKEHLTAFAKLYGIVRWFHPSDECTDADWKAIAIQGVRECLKAEEDFANRLEALFSSVAPTVRVFPIGCPDEMSDALRTPEVSQSLQIVFWEHVGLGTPFYAQYGSTTYQSQRVYERVPWDGHTAGIQDPSDVPLTPLNRQLAAWIPGTLYADSVGTLPRAVQNETELPAATLDPDACTWMLADAIVIWNLMQHFFPYFDVIDVDWDAQLELALDRMLMLGDDYTRADLKADLIVPLQDGHAGIYDAQERADKHFPDLGVTWVDRCLVVTAIGEDAKDAGIQAGDVIERIDGMPTVEVVEFIRAQYSGSAQYRTFKGWSNVLAGASGTQMDLELKRIGNGTYNAVLRRTQTSLLDEPRPDAIAQLAPGIYYVDIAHVTDAQLAAALNDFAEASGIIIDSRGYPRVPSWASYFSRDPLQSMPILTPIYRLPDQREAEFKVQRTDNSPRARWTGNAAPEFAFLIDARAVSAAEHQLSMFKCAGIGTFIGARTAGANGNINLLDLPSGVGVTWAGMIAQWPDGSTFHAEGIAPDISVSPTLQGVIEGRDETLEVALDYLLEVIGSPTRGP